MGRKMQKFRPFHILCLVSRPKEDCCVFWLSQRSPRRDSLPYSAATAKHTRLSWQWLWERRNTIWNVCSRKTCSKWCVLVATYVAFFHFINRINYVSPPFPYILINGINLYYSTWSLLQYHKEKSSAPNLVTLIFCCLFRSY